MFGVRGRKHLTQERRENSMLRAEQSRVEQSRAEQSRLRRNLKIASCQTTEVMLCH